MVAAFTFCDELALSELEVVVVGLVDIQGVNIGSEEKESILRYRNQIIWFRDSDGTT